MQGKCVAKAYKVFFHIFANAGNAAKVCFLNFEHGVPQGITQKKYRFILMT